jgi:hypothetical protein
MMLQLLLLWNTVPNLPLSPSLPQMSLEVHVGDAKPESPRPRGLTGHDDTGDL